MVETFQNLGNSLRNWAKDKVHKSLVEKVNRYEKQEEERKSSSLSQQSSETNQKGDKPKKFPRWELLRYILDY